MKRSTGKMLLRSVKKSRSRFFSMLFIVALGVAFFVGVRSAEPDMQSSADKLYDDTRFLDIWVVGTLGLTREDVAAVAAVPGVAAAEGCQTGEALLHREGREYVLNLQSLPADVSLPDIRQGRLPENAGECLMDFAMSGSFAMGDGILLDGGDTEDLTRAEYTVVGFAGSPAYISSGRGTAGIGDGSCDAVIWLLPEVFDRDYFTEIRVLAEGAAEETAFTEGYDAAVEKVRLRVEELEEARCKARYEEVRGDAEKELEEGIADAEKELADALKELEDGEKEYADGVKDLEDGEKEYADGLKELADAERKIADAEKDLAEGEKEYADGVKKLEDGEKAYAEGVKELADAEKKLQEAYEALCEAENASYEAYPLLSAAQKQLDEGKAALEAGEAEYAAGLAELERQEAQYQRYAAFLPPAQKAAAEAAFAQGRAKLAAGRAELDANAAAWEAGNRELGDKWQQYHDGRAEIDRGWIEWKAGKAELEDGRKELADAAKELENGRIELADAAKELEDGWKKLEDAKKELEDGRKELTDAQKELEDGKKELTDARKELDDGWKKYEDGRKEADEEIAKGRKEIEDIEYPEWYVLDRDAVESSVELSMDSERIGAIGHVFPVIFFLVAALVSLTTMTRMVAEERTQIGTVKALGYGKVSAMGNYLIYAAAATLLGGALGILVGTTLIPWIIQAAYGMMYRGITKYLLILRWDEALISLLAALLATVGATFAACAKALAESPAALMRPEAPKAGKRIFLEKLGFFWKQLSFSRKVSLRNLFRYRKRLFMTVAGIGGCMGLLLVGFGIWDSIEVMTRRQYRAVWIYDASVSLAKNADADALAEKWLADPDIVLTEPVYQLTVDARTAAGTESVNLFVPRDNDLQPEIVDLHTLEEAPLSLTGGGAVISAKLADLLKLSPGDELVFLDGVREKTSVRVDGIMENYLQHFALLSADSYEKYFGEAFTANRLVLNLKEGADEAALAAGLLADENLTAYSSMAEAQNTIDGMMKALYLVVLLIVTAALLLAFVVLFNLNSINITERRRELATIKLLGFRDGELALYVYRENILLTLMGILLGFVMGFYLHRYVVETLEVNFMMFGRVIRPQSYLYSAGLTFLFAVFVNFVMFFRLRKIDMIESLKSVE